MFRCPYGCHSARSSQKDLKVVVQELQKADIFSDNRIQHSRFPKCNKSMFCNVVCTDLKVWLKIILKKMVH